MRFECPDWLTLLVVHGDAVVRNRLAHAARRAGSFRAIRRMSSARFALEFILDGLHARTGDVPDIVVVDLRMPGLTGVQLTREVRRSDPQRDILIACLAGSARPREQDAAESAGCDYFLRRPDSPEALSRLLSSLARRVTTQRAYAALDAEVARRRFTCAMLSDNVV